MGRVSGDGPRTPPMFKLMSAFSEVGRNYGLRGRFDSEAVERRSHCGKESAHFLFPSVDFTLPMSSTITIIGNVNCQHYQKVKCLAEFLKTSSEGRIEIRGFFEADFERICARVQSHVPLIDVEVLIFVEEKGEDRILQFGVKSFEEWVGKNYAIFSDDWQCGDFEENMKANAERDLRDLMNPERSYVRMNFVARENDYNGSVLIEFYDDICPKSCEFLKKKLSESSVTRAIKGGWIQLGEDGGAEGGIARESFAVHHEVGGIIGLCPSGAKPGLYGKELYITTKPLEHLDGNGVAVGRVLAGLRLVEKISEIDTMGFSNQKPRVEVMVEDVSEIGVKTGVKDNSDGDIDWKSITRSILRGVMEKFVVVG